MGVFHTTFAAKEDWLAYTYQYVLNLSYPHATSIELMNKYEKSVIIYLEILKTIFISQRKNQEFNKYHDFDFLTQEEIDDLRNPKEYLRFRRVFDENYIYELMRLGYEVTGYNTISHIAGVHHVAIHVARQLKEAGIPIYLGRVSGAAAGHDIGKYGCVGDEQKRVAYYHYYYTEVWFKKFRIPCCPKPLNLGFGA